jgi:hypothetical protein
MRDADSQCMGASMPNLSHPGQWLPEHGLMQLKIELADNP